jgi:hypothetical protein
MGGRAPDSTGQATPAAGHHRVSVEPAVTG